MAAAILVKKNFKALMTFFLFSDIGVAKTYYHEKNTAFIGDPYRFFCCVQKRQWQY